MKNQTWQNLSPWLSGSSQSGVGEAAGWRAESRYGRRGMAGPVAPVPRKEAIGRKRET